MMPTFKTSAVEALASKAVVFAYFLVLDCMTLKRRVTGIQPLLNFQTIFKHSGNDFRCRYVYISIFNSDVVVRYSNVQFFTDSCVIFFCKFGREFNGHFRNIGFTFQNFNCHLAGLITEIVVAN